MADAVVSKTSVHKTCGFDSHLGHHRKKKGLPTGSPFDLLTTTPILTRVRRKSRLFLFPAQCIVGIASSSDPALLRWTDGNVLGSRDPGLERYPSSRTVGKLECPVGEPTFKGGFILPAGDEVRKRGWSAALFSCLRLDADPADRRFHQSSLFKLYCRT